MGHPDSSGATTSPSMTVSSGKRHDRLDDGRITLCKIKIVVIPQAELYPGRRFDIKSAIAIELQFVELHTLLTASSRKKSA
jgi:hypothetical protein